GYFKAAALPGRLFDLMVVGMTSLTILGWVYLYARAHGRTIRMPMWVESLFATLYVLFMNRLYVDLIYAKLGQALLHVASRFERLAAGRRV
ncbi:MAG TPA: NADH-quinone oxidoreductase subunit L, partial [Nitrospiraceae bacterium]|nr:NADH-quinone oxidoreductase subunit L [Nitrospiraceae bacterium]